MFQRLVDFFRQPPTPEPAPVEQRAAESEGGYAHTVLSGWDAYYGTQQADATQTAAVEIALGMIYRAFLLAVPTVEAPMLTPQVLGMMACQAIGRGNSVWEITLEGRTFGLMPAADFTVSGNISPTTWRYNMDFYAPGQYDPIKRNVAGEGVVHARYKPSPFAPWLGISPLVSAQLSASVLARIERSIRDDASIPTGVLMPSPDGATVDQTNTLSSAMAGGKAGITALESMKQGWGQGQGASPDEDFEQKRFGPDIPATSIGLWDKATLAIIETCGVPAALFTSEGGAQRESYRKFFTGTILGLGKLISDECEAKLEIPGLGLYFPEAIQSDLTARARALNTLVQAGLTLEGALKAVGIVGFDDYIAPLPADDEFGV